MRTTRLQLQAGPDVLARIIQEALIKTKKENWQQEHVGRSPISGQRRCASGHRHTIERPHLFGPWTWVSSQCHLESLTAPGAKPENVAVTTEQTTDQGVWKRLAVVPAHVQDSGNSHRKRRPREACRLLKRMQTSCRTLFLQKPPKVAQAHTNSKAA